MINILLDIGRVYLRKSFSMDVLRNSVFYHIFSFTERNSRGSICPYLHFKKTFYLQNRLIGIIKHNWVDCVVSTTNDYFNEFNLFYFNNNCVLH